MKFSSFTIWNKKKMIIEIKNNSETKGPTNNNSGKKITPYLKNFDKLFSKFILNQFYVLF